MKNTDNGKLRFEDKILILALILQDGGTFGFLPLNIFQILVLFLFVYFLIKSIKNKESLFLPKSAIFLILYVAVITFIHPFDFDSVKSTIFFAIEFLTFIIYFRQLRGDYLRLKKVIYTSAFILSFYGLIQIVAFNLNIPAIYDITNYGFTVNGGLQARNGIIRVHSLYSEPAHLSSIISSGIFLGIIDYKKENYPAKFKTIIMALCGLFTISTILYISVIIFIVSYFLFYQNGFGKKLKFVIPIFLIVGIILYLNPSFVEIAYGKFLTLFSASSTSSADSSGFAIISNLRVAIDKIKDGYILGTGMDSHRLYYFNYIHNSYFNVRLYLSYNDASSMFIRILSEFGIVGFVSLIFLFAKNFLKSIQKKDANMLFFALLLLVQSLRNGGYINILFMLPFVYCFCYTNKSAEQNLLSNT